MKTWLTDAGYLVQAGAFLFVLIVLAWVLGDVAHSLAGWLPPAWLRWIYPGGLLNPKTGGVLP